MRVPCCIYAATLLLFLETGASLATNVSDFKVNDDFGSTYQGYSNIATDLNGDFVVCWYDKRNSNNDIYIQLFDRNGNRQGSNRRVNDDAGTQEQLKPSMMKDQSGKFVVAWQDFRVNGYPFNGDIYSQRYLSDGSLQGANFKINDDYGTETQGWQDIDADDFGNFVVVWEDNRNSNYDIYAQRYHKSGTKLGVNFRVNDDGGTAYQHSPRVTVDGDGDFVIVWYDNRVGRDNIMAQRYNASGVAQGANFLVNDNSSIEKHVFPDIACDYNGNFTAVWIDYRNGSYPNNPDVYGRMFWADGSVRTGNFKINSDGGSAAQAEVVIGMDYFGNYIVAWRDDREGNNDIYAQYYDNSGRAVGGNYKVNNDAATATQSFPNVTMDGINIYYTWTDDRSGSFDVYAKISEYGSPSMVITPTSFQFTAALGGGNPTGQNLLISNVGYGILNWQGSSNQSWLQILPSSGTAPSTALVSINTNGLPYGNYSGRITIIDLSGEDSSRSAVVSLDVTAPLLQITPDTLIIEANVGLPPPDDKFVTISNSGSGSLTWRVVNPSPWLGLSPVSGTAPSVVDLLIDVDSLSGPGQYVADISVTSAEAANSPQSFSVHLNYVANSPILALDPDTLNFTFAVNAASIAAKELVIYNVGVGALDWSITTDSLWLAASPSSGVGDAVVSVAIAPVSLPVGEHYGLLRVSDASAYNSPVTAVVHATVTDVPPVLLVSPDSLSFVCYLNGPQDSTRSVAISNGGGGVMEWNVVDNAVWLDFTPKSGSGNSNVSAEVTTGGLPLGSYTTWAFIDAPGSSNLKDSVFSQLQIVPWLPKICGLPSSLEFKAREDIAFVDTQVVSIQNCGAPGMVWTIVPSVAWLSASPTNGVDAGSCSILMSTAGAGAGIYDGEFAVSSPQASNSPLAIPTTLIIEPWDTVSLSSANVEQGQPFVLELRLHNFLPIDSIALTLGFDDSFLAFDSVSETARLNGIMSLQVASRSSLAMTQVDIYSTEKVSQLQAGNGVIALLHLQAFPSAPQDDYTVTCSVTLRDSLGTVLTLPEATGTVSVTSATSVEPIPLADLPDQFQLFQNFPNPFNSSTVIYYTLVKPGHVRIEAFNILGQPVRTLSDCQLSPGTYSVTWDGRDGRARELSSGIYFVRLSTSETTRIIRAVLLK